MLIKKLRIDGLRNLRDVVIEPGPGLNLLTGDNGAGKTSVLEALHCLSRGRSFRGGGRHEYISRTRRKSIVVADVEAHGRTRRVGFERDSTGWRARVDGQDLKQLGQLAGALAFSVFHPELHQLIEGPPEERRRFLDFGVFHVEHGFLQHWRHYRRFLNQRNAALRARAAQDVLGSWDHGLVTSGLAVTGSREQHMADLAGAFAVILEQMAPEVAELSLEFNRGWPPDEDLVTCLRERMSSDREAGFTRRGPHRADIGIRDKSGRVAGRLSRGQQKMVAMSLLLAQVKVIGKKSGEQPVIGFDDLPSELDRTHQRKVTDLLLDSGAQLWVTGTERPDVDRWPDNTRMFHVEQGRVSEMV
ncbi:MAG: DNA replication/repair protein RecF [Xanthomonadales bacterium]|nr:DNA replication/repair protein RecF [Xanthomonadales bacterium]